MGNGAKILIAGGGTGGHIFPAIAIANALKRLHGNSEFLFVGASDRMEMQKVPEAGYKIKGLWISGLQRRLTLKNLLFPLKVLASLLKSYSIIKKFKPNVVIGVGGYSSGPVTYISTVLNIPTLIQEQNSFAGITNKLVANRVNKVCVAYEGMERFFPKEKIALLGNPVREEILEFSKITKQQALETFELKPNIKTVLIIGGSLGARTINQSIAGSLEKLQDVQLLWQCGKNYFEECQQHTSDKVKVHQFIKDMKSAYAAADVIVSRAGAISVSELCLIGKPIILVPSPNVAEDHQTKNAMALVQKDAALLVSDRESKECLADTLLGLLKDEAKQKTLSENIVKLGKPNATEDIAKAVLQLIAL